MVRPVDGILYRWRCRVAVFMATLVVSVVTVLVSGAPDASAGVLDDPDHPLYNAAGSVSNACHNIPSTLLGTASGVVAPLGFKTQQGVDPGSMPGTPPTTVPGGAPQRKWTDVRTKAQLDAQQWRIWQSMAAVDPPPTIAVPATPPATGTVDAGIGSDDYMRALLGADWWDDFKAARGLTSPVNKPMVVEASQRKAGTFQQPKLRMSTVGGSGAKVIETTGTVKVGTDTTKNPLGSARIAGAGVGAMSGSTVSLAAVVFGTGLCGTINALGAVFGDPWAEYPGTTGMLDVGSITDCPSGLPGLSSIDKCVSVDIPAARTQIRGYRTIIGPAHCGGIGLPCPWATGGPALRSPGGSTTSIINVTGGTTQDIAFACRDISNMCGLTPHEGQDGADLKFGSGLWSYQTSSTSSYREFGFIDDDMLSHGRQRRLMVTLSCKRPGDGHTTASQVYGAPFWDDEPTPDWPSASCPSGYAMTDLLLRRQTLTGGGTSTVVWTVTNVSLDWGLPNSVKNNATSLACFVAGAVCPMVDLDPENPAGNVAVGGPDGVSAPKDAPTVRDLIDEVIEESDLPEVEPDGTESPDFVPDEDAPTTTTLPPGGGPPTTLPPAPEFEPPPTSPPPPGGPDGGGGYGECLEERLDGADDDININPITWVRAILWYVAAPIICAVWWLFVPPDGWSSLLEAMRDLWDESPALGPFRAFSEALTINTSGCAPVNLPDPMGIETPTMDVALCGSAAVMVMWSVAIALGVLAVAKEAVRTFANFSRYTEEFTASGEK